MTIFEPIHPDEHKYQVLYIFNVIIGNSRRDMSKVQSTKTSKMKKNNTKCNLLFDDTMIRSNNEITF